MVIPDHIPNVKRKALVRYKEDSFNAGGRFREEIFEEVLKLEVAPKLLLFLLDLRRAPRESLSSPEEALHGFMEMIRIQILGVACLQSLIQDGLQIRILCLVPGSKSFEYLLMPEDEMFEQLG
jgi:hypothetical protein